MVSSDIQHALYMLMEDSSSSSSSSSSSTSSSSSSSTSSSSTDFEEFCMMLGKTRNLRPRVENFLEDNIVPSYDVVDFRSHFRMYEPTVEFKRQQSCDKRRPSSPTMSEAKYKEWILDTIDQLRKRKARPDLDRICHMVDRRYGVAPLQTQAEIERLVDAEVVIKVDYKGSTSYRNAAKWAKRSSLSGQVLNSNDVSRSLIEAVEYLEKQTVPTDVHMIPAGVGVSDIEKYLVEKNTNTKLTKSKLQVALEREIVATNLLKLPNGNYTVFKKRLQASQEPNKIESAVPVSNVNLAKTNVKKEPTLNGGKSFLVPSKKGRPPNKRKRFKKTHGPDFVENYDSSFEEPEPKCDYCLLTAAYNCNGKPEELLICKDCNAKAHPSCMDYSADLAMRSRMSPWQCMDCKTCYVCDDSGDAGSMLFCDACDKGYHMGCHVPRITEKPQGKWVCCQCVDDVKAPSIRLPVEREMTDYETEQPMNQTIDGAPGLPTPCDSPIPEAEQNKRTFDFYFSKKEDFSENKENNEIPDASDWSIADVEDYFRGAGFPDQAAAFKEQEIDGKSLLLLKRSDVLTGLSIKLGPALKIYNHVKRLQTRRADGHLIF